MPLTSPARSLLVSAVSVTTAGHTANPSAESSHAGKLLPLTVPFNHQPAPHNSHLLLPFDALHRFFSDSQNLALPTWYQPSKSDIFQQHFTAHFVGNFFNPESFATPQNGWAHHLPSILSLVKSPAVEAAVRATTMAFYGIKADDVAIKAEACRWYCKGLRDLRIELERASSARSVHRLDVASALAPLLFSIFETFMVTNPSGWIQHILAADRFLELLGPDACKDGLGHGLLRAVRLGVGCAANEWERPPVIASEEWCKTPFIIHGKTAYDLLDDILIQLPACHILRRDFEALGKYGTSEEIARLVLKVEAAGRALLHKLEMWWSVHGHTSHKRPFDERVCPQLPIDTRIDRPGGTFNFSPQKLFSSSRHAQKIAQFNAISLAGFGLLYLATKKSYRKELTAHGESILAAVSFDQDCNVGRTGSTSMLFPLITLYYYSTADRRLQAATKTILHAWSKPRGVSKFVREATTIDNDSA
ncbi:hypothetical protein XANCAGTX0491_008392 [Xanthoria calcicola]